MYFVFRSASEKQNTKEDKVPLQQLHIGYCVSRVIMTGVTDATSMLGADPYIL